MHLRFSRSLENVYCGRSEVVIGHGVLLPLALALALALAVAVLCRGIGTKCRTPPGEGGGSKLQAEGDRPPATKCRAQRERSESAQQNYGETACKARGAEPLGRPGSRLERSVRTPVYVGGVAGCPRSRWVSEDGAAGRSREETSSPRRNVTSDGDSTSESTLTTARPVS